MFGVAAERASSSIVVGVTLLEILVMKDLISKLVGQLFWQGASAHFRHLWKIILILKPHNYMQNQYTWKKIVFHCFKGIVHPKMYIYWKCTHPQAIQDINNFVSLSKQIWGNLALHHLLTNGCSEWVPSEWEFKLLINITITYTNPVHQLTSCEVKSCVFVRNKSIIKAF